MNSQDTSFFFLFFVIVIVVVVVWGVWFEPSYWRAKIVAHAMEFSRQPIWLQLEFCISALLTESFGNHQYQSSCWGATKQCISCELCLFSRTLGQTIPSWGLPFVCEKSSDSNQTIPIMQYPFNVDCKVICICVLIIEYVLMLGGKQRSSFYYDIWNIKYLSKFKCDDLASDIGM